MKTYLFNDDEFKKTNSYQNFISANPEEGYLKIRAYAASGALPISDLKIVVSKVIDNNNIVFYEGMTNSSGVIEKIPLPAPKLIANNLTAPQSEIYQIDATYQNIKNKYQVNIYENIYVVQTINIVPTMDVMSGDNRWL